MSADNLGGHDIPGTPQRQSVVSSVAVSFQTAQGYPSSPSSHSLIVPHDPNTASSALHSSSVPMLGLEPTTPEHMLDISPVIPAGSTAIPEVHIVKLTNESVHVESGPITDTFFHKVSHTTMTELHAGPPPPSPPASVDRVEEEEQERALESPAPASPLQSTILSSMSGSGSILGGSLVSPPITHQDSPQAGPSTDSRPVRRTSPARLTFRQDPTLDTAMQDNPVPKSADGYLQPPPVSAHRDRPTRRNTTGSNVRANPTRHVSHGSHPITYEDGDIDGELASDIQAHAEQIRRERLSKRAKAQEAEARLKDDNGPLVGNLIGEDHANYVLMYNMLTGIRIGVSRCQAKIKRPLTDEDFVARHKFSFDIVGNELTPSAKYDFKFKDYAPWIFRALREDVFHLDPADYLLSLTAKYILSELGSPGKSGSFFYFSRDYRFIIKTIHHSEHKYLLRILKQYHLYVKDNPHTLLSRFYGLHRVKLPHGRKIHFVIMNNLFPPHRDIHETYDLKGSTVGRLYPEERAAQNPRAVLKDLNWIDRGKTLELGPEKWALLTEQLRRDSEWLRSVNVMDYSLLVGIHNMQRGNRDNLRRNTLKVFSPDVPDPPRRKPAQQKGAKSPEAIAMRRAIGSGQTAPTSLALPEDEACTVDRQHFLFYQDEGGLRATGDENESMDTIYYLGVIDILTPYTLLKRAEHLYKGMKADRHKISPVPPTEYSERFFSFMKAIMRGGGGGARFKPE